MSKIKVVTIITSYGHVVEFAGYSYFTLYYLYSLINRFATPAGRKQKRTQQTVPYLEPDHIRSRVRIPSPNRQAIYFDTFI